MKLCTWMYRYICYILDHEAGILLSWPRLKFDCSTFFLQFISFFGFSSKADTFMFQRQALPSGLRVQVDWFIFHCCMKCVTLTIAVWTFEFVARAQRLSSCAAGRGELLWCSLVMLCWAVVFLMFPCMRLVVGIRYQIDLKCSFFCCLPSILPSSIVVNERYFHHCFLLLWEPYLYSTILHTRTKEDLMRSKIVLHGRSKED